MTSKISLKYDSTLQYKLKESEEQLKTIITSNDSHFDIFFELDEKVNEIVLQLEKHEIFNEELDYFLLITDQILYILYKNCKSDDFGHLEFAVELFDFFIEIWNAKIRLIENFSKKEFEKYSNFLIESKKRYHGFRCEFYWNIYKYSDDFDEKETYKFAKSLRV